MPQANKKSHKLSFRKLSGYMGEMQVISQRNLKAKTSFIIDISRTFHQIKPAPCPTILQTRDSYF